METGPFVVEVQGKLFVWRGETEPRLRPYGESDAPRPRQITVSKDQGDVITASTTVEIALRGYKVSLALSKKQRKYAPLACTLHSAGAGYDKSAFQELERRDEAEESQIKEVWEPVLRSVIEESVKMGLV